MVQQATCLKVVIVTVAHTGIGSTATPVPTTRPGTHPACYISPPAIYATTRGIRGSGHGLIGRLGLNCGIRPAIWRAFFPCGHRFRRGGQLSEIAHRTLPVRERRAIAGPDVVEAHGLMDIGNAPHIPNALLRA